MYVEESTMLKAKLSPNLTSDQHVPFTPLSSTSLFHSLPLPPNKPAFPPHATANFHSTPKGTRFGPRYRSWIKHVAAGEQK
ncbi:uncharacterized protein SETTUDRAFT_162608 [Exserohilum turcica Et28A]|uniref:Uncharacterized protein n=1 Tax=Exserohilum turcicum (strain 28A) TaxID=671987 RepID=R0J5Z9_EXST2|nr:uncharacterized protein SETTUDRAFT_162608 [Exserohilum turcica Et28A]EOA92111.1 hypothetical protein SETTUDRAFT_162608 [Exserohilum turcica Et28A]